MPETTTKDRWAESKVGILGARWVQGIDRTILYLTRALTPEEEELMRRIREMKECCRCKTSPITSFAQSYFTWEIICAPCWYKELEVMAKLKKQGKKNIREYENIGYIPEV